MSQPPPPDPFAGAASSQVVGEAVGHGWPVRVEGFEGPLDLLLHLARRAEVPIEDIAVAAVTEQCLERLTTVGAAEIDPAGELLVLAAALLEIKSEALLPAEAPDTSTETASGQVPSPHGDLVRQLLAYRAYQEAADRLAQQALVTAQRWGRPPPRALSAALGDTPDTDSEGDDLGDLEVWELLKVFAKLLEDTGGGRAVHQIDYQETPIEIVVAQVRARLEADGDLSLAQLLVGRVGRIEIVGVFLALLELAKQRVITLEQTHQYGPITARLRPADQRGHDLYETALAARLVAGATSPTDDTANPQPGDTLGLEGLLPTHADPTPPVGGADPVALTAGGDHSPADDSPVANAPPDDEVAASQAMFASDDDIDPDLLDEELAAIVVPEIDLDATLGLPTGTGPQSPSQPDPANRPGVPAEPPRPGRVRR